MKEKLLFKTQIKQVLLLIVMVLGGAVAFAQVMMPLPPHSSNYTGSARGYWFTAPTTFLITGVRVPTNASTAASAIHLVKFNAGAPPTYSATTTNFTTLGYWNNVAGNTIISTSVLVNAGDIIGVLGTRNATTNSYGSGTYTSNIFGMAVPLNRLIHQGSIANVPAPNFSNNAPGSIGRVELYYGAAVFAPNDAKISEITSPGTYCVNSYLPLTVKLENTGSLPLDSCMVVWDLNGVQDSSWFTVNLDTLLGAGSSDTLLTIDTLTLGAGAVNVTVYPKWPNNVADTINTYDTAFAALAPALSGTYVIDPAGGGDFLSFTDAVNAMSTSGICGPTIIEAVDSTYIEQIELENFVGMSSTNTVTFRSQSGNPDGVNLSYAATGSADNHVVKMFDADYYTFENMTFTALGATYGYVFNTWGADSLTINNCNITCVSTGSQAYPIRAYYYNSGVYASSHDFTLTNSTLTGGYYSLYYYNYSQDPANDGVIENNEFINPYYRAVYAYYAKDLQFNNNHVVSNSTYTSAYAFYLYQITGGSISNNFVEGTTSWPRYGMYLGYCQGDLSTFMPIVGNRVSLPSSNAQYGMYAYQNLFSELAHNSIYMAGSNSYGMYMSSGSYNKLKNNIIQLSGGGYGMYVNGSPIYQSDYNNISTPNAANAGYMGGVQASLADWQLASGYDSNSVSVNMVFSDTASMKVCTDSLYGMGESLPMYMYDFEGDMRQTMPCIGADEFMPISQFGFNVNPVLCNGDTLTLTQGYYDTVVWNTTDTTNTYAIYAPGTQTVSVYDACGSDTSVFNVDAQIMAAIGDTNLCEGTTADLGTGISGGMYLWSDGSTDSTINVATAGTVSVQVMDAHGCESADTAVVTASFDVVLPDSSTFCEGSSVVLDANMTGTYVWSDGSSNQTLAVTASGVYSVTVTDQNCLSTSTSNVTEILDAVPSFTDSSSYLTVIFTNTSMYATDYLWDFGDGTTSTDVSPTHIYPWTSVDSMNYTVTLTATNSCGGVDAVNDGVRAGQMVSVSELELANMVNVYPNPNNGLFNVSVKTDDTQDMSVEVMDVRGSVVFTQSYGQVTGEVNREVNLANAASGIYFVKVTLDGETIVYRLSVK